VTTRLYQSLVDAGLAISVQAHVAHLRDPGLFQVHAILRPDVEHQQVENIILEELNKLKTEAVTEQELERAKKKIEAEVYFARDGALQFAFALGESESSADWHWFLTYVPNIEQVTPADLQRVATEYLQRDNSTIGWFVPKNSTPIAGEFVEGGEANGDA
jgi:zinc protease